MRSFVVEFGRCCRPTAISTPRATCAPAAPSPPCSICSSNCKSCRIFRSRPGFWLRPRPKLDSASWQTQRLRAHWRWRIRTLPVWSRAIVFEDSIAASAILRRAPASCARTLSPATNTIYGTECATTSPTGITFPSLSRKYTPPPLSRCESFSTRELQAWNILPADRDVTQLTSWLSRRRLVLAPRRSAGRACSACPWWTSFCWDHFRHRARRLAPRGSYCARSFWTRLQYLVNPDYSLPAQWRSRAATCRCRAGSRRHQALGMYHVRHRPTTCQFPATHPQLLPAHFPGDYPPVLNQRRPAGILLYFNFYFDLRHRRRFGRPSRPTQVILRLASLFEHYYFFIIRGSWGCRTRPPYPTFLAKTSWIRLWVVCCFLAARGFDFLLRIKSLGIEIFSFDSRGPFARSTDRVAWFPGTSPWCAPPTGSSRSSVFLSLTFASQWPPPDRTASFGATRYFWRNRLIYFAARCLLFLNLSFIAATLQVLRTGRRWGLCTC